MAHVVSCGALLSVVQASLRLNDTEPFHVTLLGASSGHRAGTPVLPAASPAGSRGRTPVLAAAGALQGCVLWAASKTCAVHQASGFRV